MLQCNEFDNGGMELVFVAHRCRAAFEVADVRIVVRYNQSPLELPRVGGVYTEIGAKFHRAAHPFGDIHERTVGKHSRIERGEEIVAIAHHAPQIFLHQVRMVLHRLAERAENDALFGKVFLESRLYRYAVHHGIDRHPAQNLLFFQGYAQFVESLEQLRVHLAQILGTVGFLPGGSIINYILVINRRDVQMRPRGHLQRLPMAESPEAELEQPLRFVFLGRDDADGLFVEPPVYSLCIYVGDKPVFVLAGRHLVYYFV